MKFLEKLKHTAQKKTQKLALGDLLGTPEKTSAAKEPDIIAELQARKVKPPFREMLAYANYDDAKNRITVYLDMPSFKLIWKYRVLAKIGTDSYAKRQALVFHKREAAEAYYSMLVSKYSLRSTYA